MAAHGAGTGVSGASGGGKDVLPAPFSVGVGVVLFKIVGKVDGAVTLVQVAPVEFFNVLQVFLERSDEAVWKHGEVVYFAFGVAHGDLAVVKVNVYDAQAQALDQAQPRTVEQPGDELIDARHGSEYHFNLFFGEDVGQVF